MLDCRAAPATGGVNGPSSWRLLLREVLMCEVCQEVLQWIWETLVEGVTAWAQKCKKKKCKWWCLCCNKWFCWIVAVISYIIALVLAAITLVACAVCYGLCYTVCFMACVLNKLAGKPAPANCLTDCVAVCSGQKAPADVGTGTGTTGGGLTTPPQSGTVSPGPGGGTVAPISRVGDPREVTDVAQLLALTRWPAVLRGPSAVALRVPGLDREVAAALESGVNRVLPACGCHEGAVALLIAVVVYAGYLVLAADVQSLRWSALWIGLVVAFCAAAGGKLIGIGRARIALGKLARQLEAEAR